MSEVPAAAVEAAEAAIHASQAYWNCSQAAEVAVAVAAPLIRQAAADEIYQAADAWDAAHTDRWRDRWAGHISTGMRKAAEIARHGRVGGGGGGGQ
jgi:hypothetical protein